MKTLAMVALVVAGLMLAQKTASERNPAEHAKSALIPPNEASADRDDQSADLDAQLAEPDQEMAEKDQEAVERDQELAERDGEAAERDQELAVREMDAFDCDGHVEPEPMEQQ
jgi:hypothetical protein